MTSSNIKPSLENIKAAEELVKKYESLTIKDVIGKSAAEITGVGDPSRCLLCISVGGQKYAEFETCQYCIYKSTGGCYHGEHSETIHALEDAKTPEEMLKAYYNRAQHIRGILEKLKQKDDKYFKINELSDGQLLFVDRKAVAAGFLSGNFMQVRKGGEFADKAFYLAKDYNWNLLTDEHGDLCLVPTKKSDEIPTK